MTLNNALKKQIVKSPDAVELRRIAIASGMTSLLHNGIELILKGITTCSEVLRSTRGAQDEE
jgi:general secretion pathway protein E